MNFRNSAALAKTFRRRSVWLAGFLLCFVGLSGCVTLRPIPGTKIADTPLHRELFQRVEEYRIAMEQRDAGKLLSMAHPNYYEDSAHRRRKMTTLYAGLKRAGTRLSSVRAGCAT